MDAPLSIDQFNRLDPAAAAAMLLRCCAATRWAEAVARARPYSSQSDLLLGAAHHWRQMGEADYLEAFSAHPEIGEAPGDPPGDPQSADAARTMAMQEQRGVQGAAAPTMEALAEGNRTYRKQFGFTFIVCASGKSAEEMLDLLHARLRNPRAVEIAAAAVQQEMITHLRMRAMFTR